VAVVVAVPAPATLAAVGTVGREHVSYSHCGIPFPPRWGTDIPRRPLCVVSLRRGSEVSRPRSFPGNFQERRFYCQVISRKGDVR
jgi:hypothetical protein